MCGIGGVAFSRNRSSEGLSDVLAAMARAMHQRGPDDEGIFIAPDADLGLVNRRLAIRDLSPMGHMPMSNADGGVWITYNGELYNADELRTELTHLGYRFRSSSDTEAILHGYEAWGVGVLQRLRGMFALALYDGRGAPAVLLARDQLGIKPLYYGHTWDAFAFASECRALHSSSLLSRELDPAGLVAYLELGSVPAPLSIYRDIRALEAGQYLWVTWDTRGDISTSQPVRYWTLPKEPPPRMPYPDVVARVRQALSDSVRRHLISDVPIGAFLSGGLDSSCVVALMRQASPGGVIRTCSVVFDEREYSEEAYARSVAKDFATDHVSLLVRPSDVDAELDNIIASLDQPSNDGVNSYFVSKAARHAGLTVALSGLGGDELFGGYPTFHRLPELIRVMRLVGVVPGASTLAGAVLGSAGQHRATARLAGRLRGDGSPEARAYLAIRGLFSERDVTDLVRPEVLANGHADFSLESFINSRADASSSLSSQQLASRFELTCYMRHQLLRDTDVMSMAHSLEVRVPFVDCEVIAATLDVGLTAPAKSLSKQALRDAIPRLPAIVRDRADKQGFTFPLANWMSGPLKPRVDELVYSVERELSAYLQPRACERVLSAFHASDGHWSRVWALAALACTV